MMPCHNTSWKTSAFILLPLTDYCCIQIGSSTCALIWNKAISRIWLQKTPNKPTKKKSRKHKEFGHCVTFPVACSFCCLSLKEQHRWAKDLKRSLFVINCTVELNGLKGRLIFHIYIYPNITFPSADPRQEGKLLVLQLRPHWSFTWSSQHAKKISAASNQKFPLLFKGNLLNNHQKKVTIWNILLKGKCSCTSCTGNTGWTGR